MSSSLLNAYNFYVIATITIQGIMHLFSRSAAAAAGRMSAAVSTPSGTATRRTSRGSGIAGKIGLKRAEMH